MPGLFADPTDSSAFIWRLLGQGVLEGFDDLHVLMAWSTPGGQFIHTNFPVSGLETLRGKKIRSPAKVFDPLFEALGAEPVFMPINKVAAAIEDGELDGVSTGVNPLLSGALLKSRTTISPYPSAAFCT